MQIKNKQFNKCHGRNKDFNLSQEHAQPAKM